MKAIKNKENKPRAKTVGKVKGKGEGKSKGEVKSKVEELVEEVMVAAKIYGFKPVANKKLGGLGGDINIMVITHKKEKLVLKVCKN